MTNPDLKRFVDRLSNAVDVLLELIDALDGDPDAEDSDAPEDDDPGEESDPPEDDDPGGCEHDGSEPDCDA